MGIFETIYLIGFVLATVIRTYYGRQFKRKEIVHSQTENPIVFVGMALWGIALVAPLIVIFSNGLAVADYEITTSLRIIGASVFTVSLWLLWRSHADLATNFSPSLFIQKNHTLVSTGIYRKIRHPMYLSFLMWAIGQSMLIANWVAGPLGLLAFLLIYLFRVEREEQQLLNQFGAEYAQYQKRTGRLLPKFTRVRFEQ